MLQQRTSNKRDKAKGKRTPHGDEERTSSECKGANTIIRHGQQEVFQQPARVADPANSILTNPDLSNFKEAIGTDPLTATSIATSDYYHAEACLSQAIASANNSGPMVGTCPQCSGLASEQNASTIIGTDTVPLRKVDLSAISGTRLPQVLFQTTSSQQDMSDLVEAGTVVVASAGNGVADNPSNQQPNVEDPNSVTHITTLYPSAAVWAGPSVCVQGSIPSKDVNIIYVGPTQDGQQYDKFCNGWNTDGHTSLTQSNFAPPTLDRRRTDTAWLEHGDGA